MLYLLKVELLRLFGPCSLKSLNKVQQSPNYCNIDSKQSKADKSVKKSFFRANLPCPMKSQYSQKILTLDQKIKDPSPESIINGNYINRDLEVDTLKSGDCYCQAELINGEPMKCSLIADIPTEIILLPENEFNQIDKELKEEFLHFGTFIPSDEELRSLYFERVKWNKYKRYLQQTLIQRSKCNQSSFGHPMLDLRTSSVKSNNFTNKRRSIN